MWRRAGRQRRKDPSTKKIHKTSFAVGGLTETRAEGRTVKACTADKQVKARVARDAPRSKPAHKKQNRDKAAANKRSSRKS